VQRVSVAYGHLLRALAFAAAALLLCMTLVVTGDIVLRNTIGSGFIWANEVSEYALYLTTLLVAPWLLREGRHVRLDLLLVMVPQRVAWRIEIVADVLGLLVCIFLVRYGAIMALESRRLGSITIKNLVFPEWWLLAPLPAIFALLGVEFIFRLHRLYEGERKRRNDATSVG
jgi:TRAP-type C4-dicarboxylate transport system permease small subunit